MEIDAQAEQSLRFPATNPSNGSMGTYVPVTSQPSPRVRFRRAIERRALWAAEDAARELPNLPLEDALQLVHLYADRGSPKFEKAAMRWLERYLTEDSPRLQHFAEITASLASREPES
jgi:hypothetical protein